MLKRLAEKYPTSIAPLTYQYRMNAAICQLSSEAVYSGSLKCANDQVSSRIVSLPHYPKGLQPPISKEVVAWLPEVINPRRSVLFLDTDKIKSDRPSSHESPPLMKQIDPARPAMDALEEKIGGKYDGKIVNRTEADLVRQILKGLISVGLDPSEIGVICPFRAQVCNVRSKRRGRTMLKIRN
jgi:superfamily I DNA and/or RNA helicase